VAPNDALVLGAADVVGEITTTRTNHVAVEHGAAARKRSGSARLRRGLHVILVLRPLQVLFVRLRTKRIKSFVAKWGT
jgi:hypothetical protein